MSLFLIATGLTGDCGVQQGDNKLLADFNAVGGSVKNCVRVYVSRVISFLSVSAGIFQFSFFEISCFLSY